MSEEVQEKGVDPKEIQQEDEFLKETPAEEVRKSIIEKHNLDEDVDSELIEKLATEATELRKQLATAIKQKRSWREKATAKIELKPAEVKPQPSPELKPKESEIETITDKKVREILDEEKLNVVDLSDEIKKEIKSYAKTAGITIQEALKSDFFEFKKQKYDAAKKADDASIGGRRGSPSRQEFDILNPPKVDMSTKEGQETWEAFKVWRKTQK